MIVFLVPMFCLILVALCAWIVYTMRHEANSIYETYRAFYSAVGIVAAVLGLVSIYSAHRYYGAGIRANTYNQINGTQYTQEQFYYAPDVIDPSLNQEK